MENPSSTHSCKSKTKEKEKQKKMSRAAKFLQPAKFLWLQIFSTYEIALPLPLFTFPAPFDFCSFFVFFPICPLVIVFVLVFLVFCKGGLDIKALDKTL